MAAFAFFIFGGATTSHRHRIFLPDDDRAMKATVEAAIRRASNSCIL